MPPAILTNFHHCAKRVARANTRRARSLAPSAAIPASVTKRGAKAARLSSEHTRRRAAKHAR